MVGFREGRDSRPTLHGAPILPLTIPKPGRSLSARNWQPLLMKGLTMVKLQFTTSNAAFADRAAIEIAGILRSLADRVEKEGFLDHVIPIYDSNCDQIGSCSITT